MTIATPSPFAPSRRGFLRAATGLVIAVALPAPRLRAQEAGGGPPKPGPVPTSAFVHVAPDDTVTVMVKHLEMGQGPLTGLTTLVADEMDADWSQMRGSLAPADKVYANLAFGMQGTGGSTAMANSFIQMRTAGAQARAMLVEAAAQAWGVPASEITVSKGRITHASGKDSGFGAFADAAAKLPVPEKPTLKTPDQWVLIGTDVPKLDTGRKSNGTAQFTLDLYPEGVQVVLVEHPDRFGATVRGFDDSKAAAVPGVRAIRQIPQGVAIYADNTFAALKARKLLAVDWDISAAETRDTAALMEEVRKAAQEDGRTVEEDGDLQGFDAEGAHVVTAEYAFPYLAHAPLEPLDGVITLTADGKAEASYGCQFPGLDHGAIAKTLGLPIEAVRVNVLLAGGSFGRRAQGTSHFAIELADVAKAGGPGTYKLMWTREDDIRGGYYRPMTVHRMRGAITPDGAITAWEDVVANQSIMAGTAMEATMQNGLDSSSFEGSTELPYAMGGRRVAWRRVDRGVPVLWWRSVGSTHTAFATEMLVDELLTAAGKDPLQGRLDLLKPDAKRERAVIEAVRELSGWTGSKRDGKGYGIGYAKSFGTYVAQVAEVEDRGGRPGVTRVWCAVDCGVPVNPNVIRAQMEGGIGYGLAAALYSQISFGPEGQVMERNFDDYRIMRIGDMPQVDVTILRSDADPTGVGEPGVPPIGPAVANAWRALTGQPTRQLPFVTRTGSIA